MKTLIGLKPLKLKTTPLCHYGKSDGDYHFVRIFDRPQPSEYGRQCTLNSVYGHTVARLQSNDNLAMWISQISTEWRECSIKTLSTIHWVPVQHKGSKVLCGKLGAMKIATSDFFHQEYLTINLGSTSDWLQLMLPLVRLFGRWRANAGQQEQPGAENAGGGAVCCYLTFQSLLQTRIYHSHRR